MIDKLKNTEEFIKVIRTGEFMIKIGEGEENILAEDKNGEKFIMSKYDAVDVCVGCEFEKGDKEYCESCLYNGNAFDMVMSKRDVIKRL